MKTIANLEYQRPDGQSCRAYCVEPALGKRTAGVVLIQEWWGLNAQIVGVAGRLVQAGYRVLVPDLFRGERPLDEAEAEHSMKELDFNDAASQDVRGAIQHLKTNSPKVASLGFCIGGVLSLLAAMHAPENDAAVSWYGVPPPEAGDPAAIDIPVQCHFARQDNFFPLDKADALEDKLEQGKVENECYRYDAQHAFGNETWDQERGPQKHKRLRLPGFGQLFRPFSLNRTTIRLKWSKNLTQNRFASPAWFLRPKLLLRRRGRRSGLATHRGVFRATCKNHRLTPRPLEQPRGPG